MKEQRQPGPGMRGGTSTVLNEGRRRFCRQMGGLGVLGVDATRSFSYLKWGGSSVAEGLAGTQETLALPLV